jgi:hypothetical protein
MCQSFLPPADANRRQLLLLPGDRHCFQSFDQFDSGTGQLIRPTPARKCDQMFITPFRYMIEPESEGSGPISVGSKASHNP